MVRYIHITVAYFPRLIFLNTYNYLLIFFCKQDNLVGTVVIISLLIWIPISCLISWIDRQRAERDQKVHLFVYIFCLLLLSLFTFCNIFFLRFLKEWEWRRQDELIHPEDKRRIIHIRVPRRTVSMAASNCN